MQHIKRGGGWPLQLLAFLDRDENIQKLIKTKRIFEPFPLVKYENALITLDKQGVILKLRKSFDTSNTNLRIDFTCYLSPF